jgi:hypothetical protein
MHSERHVSRCAVPSPNWGFVSRGRAQTAPGQRAGTAGRQAMQPGRAADLHSCQVEARLGLQVLPPIPQRARVPQQHVRIAHGERQRLALRNAGEFREETNAGQYLLGPVLQQEWAAVQQLRGSLLAHQLPDGVRKEACPHAQLGGVFQVACSDLRNCRAGRSRIRRRQQQATHIRRFTRVLTSCSAGGPRSASTVGAARAVAHSRCARATALPANKFREDN